METRTMYLERHFTSYAVTSFSLLLDFLIRDRLINPKANYNKAASLIQFISVRVQTRM